MFFIRKWGSWSLRSGLHPVKVKFHWADYEERMNMALYDEWYEPGPRLQSLDLACNLYMLTRERKRKLLLYGSRLFDTLVQI